tara:strand:- start:901 stop:1767 length:867 start_codon:yes stop_codon:yes gene_type:complete
MSLPNFAALTLSDTPTGMQAGGSSSGGGGGGDDGWRSRKRTKADRDTAASEKGTEQERAAKDANWTEFRNRFWDWLGRVENIGNDSEQLDALKSLLLQMVEWLVDKTGYLTRVAIPNDTLRQQYARLFKRLWRLCAKQQYKAGYDVLHDYINHYIFCSISSRTRNATMSDEVSSAVRAVGRFVANAKKAAAAAAAPAAAASSSSSNNNPVVDIDGSSEEDNGAGVVSRQGGGQPPAAAEDDAETELSSNATVHDSDDDDGGQQQSPVPPPPLPAPPAPPPQRRGDPFA